MSSYLLQNNNLSPRPRTNYQKKYRTTPHIVACNNMQHVICYLQRNFLKNIFFVCRYRVN